MEEQSQYQNLVMELKKPGSTSRAKKVTLVLWTARPTKDRDRYEGARDIPSNIFLSSSSQDAWGLAHDLGGNEVRDLWRVEIDASNVIQTLDTGRIRQYQTTGMGRVPVKRTELYEEGMGRMASVDKDKTPWEEASSAFRKLPSGMGFEKGLELAMEAEMVAISEPILDLVFLLSTADGLGFVNELKRKFEDAPTEEIIGISSDVLGTLYALQEAVSVLIESEDTKSYDMDELETSANSLESITRGLDKAIHDMAHST